MRGILAALTLSACGDPDLLGGRSWDCLEGRGERVIDGVPTPCPVATRTSPDDPVELRAWSLTLPGEDGPGTFIQLSRPDGADPGDDLPTELPADAVRLGPSAWSLDVPTYRCAGCDTLDGLQDGLTLTCAPLPDLPARIACGGTDGGGTGWDLRLAETP